MAQPIKVNGSCCCKRNESETNMAASPIMIASDTLRPPLQPGLRSARRSYSSAPRHEGQSL
jgi:hypothetical protein